MGKEADRVDNGALATVFIVLGLALIGVVSAVIAFARTAQQDEIARKGGVVNLVPYRQDRAQQRIRLTEPPRYLDAVKGVVGLPIELAQYHVVRELKEHPEWATPAPPMASASASAATLDAAAAPSALPSASAVAPAATASTAPAATTPPATTAPPAPTTPLTSAPPAP